MDDKNYFSEEYIPESSTENFSSESKTEKETDERKDDYSIDKGKYGEAKPTRIIIKAKIING